MTETYNPIAHVVQQDPEVADILRAELDRMRSTIELIASENLTSIAVMEASGSVPTNKYAEGYPGKRFYGGCDKVDLIEQLAIDRAKKLFNVEFANVQPHSGVQANYAAYTSIIKPGDTILGMELSNGGHLSHGSTANFSGRMYDAQSYSVGADERIDYDAVLEKAKECRPAVIVAGASAYPRVIDFARFAEIAHEVGAYLMVDMAHICGLVATGAHPSPFPHADIVTTTTHKTLRGPRGGMILTNDEEIARKVNSAVFPGSQGGPLMHVIAAKAVALGEALSREFVEYIDDVVANCATMAAAIAEGGLRLVSGGTDNHLCLVDLNPADITGKEAEQLVEGIGLTVNKNAIPNDTRSPFVTSGIRVGSAAATSRGVTNEEFRVIGSSIAEAVFNAEDETKLAALRARIQKIIDAHPVYPELEY